MKSIVFIICASILAACGGNSQEVKPILLAKVITNESCRASVECTTRILQGDTIKTCDEKIVGYQLMSSWDSGKSWQNGSCEQTAE